MKAILTAVQIAEKRLENNTISRILGECHG